MGERSHRKTKKSSKRKDHSKEEDESDSTTSSSPPSSSSYSSESDDDDDYSRRKRSHKRRRSDSLERKHRRKRRSSSGKKESSRRREKRRSKAKREKGKRYYSDSDSDDSGEGSGPRDNPEEVLRCLLKEFPAVAGELEQLLLMIDDGQAVDIRGLSERALIKHLRRLFLSLNLKETDEHAFILKSKQQPTLKVVGPIIRDHVQPRMQQLDNAVSEKNMNAELPDARTGQDVEINNPSEDNIGPRKRVIGPEMPSAELLAAAAKLTEAEAELREAEIGDDSDFFIGPPPPALVTEAESSNEAERFEEITRIMGAEADSPYDILGVNRNMSAENMKKRYWKLSLMVHPDKCSHPQAHQAFVKLNKAFKDLQDPDKRKAMDDKIKEKEEQEEFKAELKAMKEAAQWRRLQGISMEGDDILLADMEVKVEPKRDEWMTTLPPERKPGMTMQSTKFSQRSKEGRGDTSVWTDTPSDRAQKAKMNYLEAYNEAAALASNELEKKQRANADAQLVDEYNKSKRSKSLVEKHKESIHSRAKKKSKQEPVKEEWEGNHPWKPWDREKDLTAGRLSVKLDAENMAQGLSSRFSSGSFQRNFL
ncbi:OLC1v1031859C1 [Oldenlandia corymbosa var. corymbosa]|uniref:OLC1v1031859C1 n=1 Tax=Oldenlandia corymbosa var. corymbosa TaxID=529605 RepID=A0AAV1CKF1_OLDCO|nr:OLC1v1031859C1 [Oldenlandia corymbosa var. corymbosa]